ncbi:hypothetical protein [Ornithinimicrobium sufpigmenti]|uniref:hypothetical protein n=1 Tax=Ornithinimicrobium sufpigmenti TaxID=2508882 RepID=UPI001036C284|nr:MULTISPECIES: hypothetical protein [unclassified Ornithinimicrobium]
MTSPKYAGDTDHGRYYTHPEHPGRTFISITNVLDSIAKPALVPWAAKVTAEKALDLMPQMVAAALIKPCKPKRVADECGTCLDCLHKTTKREVKVVRETAADLGTLVHAFAEAHLTGQEIQATDEDREAVAPFVAQYLRFLDDFEVDITRDVEAAELTVCHPTYGYAGTLDAIVRLRLDGNLAGVKPKQLPDDQRALWVYDIKTSSTKPANTLYDEQPLQLAAQRNAKEAWLPDGSIVPMPRTKGAAILNLRVDDYAFIPVPSGPEEFAAFRGFITGQSWMHGDHAKACAPITPSGRARAAKPKTTIRTRKAA